MILKINIKNLDKSLQKKLINNITDLCHANIMIQFDDKNTPKKDTINASLWTNEYCIIKGDEYQKTQTIDAYDEKIDEIEKNIDDLEDNIYEIIDKQNENKELDEDDIEDVRLYICYNIELLQTIKNKEGEKNYEIQ